MLERMGGRLGPNHAGEIHRETVEARAGRILAEELRRFGWQDAELAARPESDPAKLAIAARLRKESILSIKAIAARAHLGASKSANARSHGWRRGGGTGQFPTKFTRSGLNRNEKRSRRWLTPVTDSWGESMEPS